jgi:hypothetical protein
MGRRFSLYSITFNFVTSPGQMRTGRSPRRCHPIGLIMLRVVIPMGLGFLSGLAFNANSPAVMELGDDFAPIPVASPIKLEFWKRFFQTQPAW